MEGVGVAQDRDKARAYFEEGCKAKDVWGCHRLADLLGELGLHNERLQYYKQSCEYGYELSCMAQADVMMSAAKTKTEWTFIMISWTSGAPMVD